MKISDVRIRFVKKDESKLKAVASITIDDCFAVHDIKVQSPCVFYSFDLFP